MWVNGKFFLTIEYQQINVEGMMALGNHYFDNHWDLGDSGVNKSVDAKRIG